MNRDKRSVWAQASALLLVVATLGAQAAFEIPKESKVLGATRGKPCNTGLVFINGRYIEAPYVVERWGTGIRINKIPVMKPVIEWSEFLKTQEGVKVTKTEEAPAPAPVAESEPPKPAAPPPPTVADDDSSLDDLFEDDPKPKVQAKIAKPVAAPKPKAPPKPKTVVSYELTGGFVPNEATKAMVSRINGVRTEIDRILRQGGFICFGEKYSRITGDERTTMKLIETLPEVLQRANSPAQVEAQARAAGLVYFHEVICSELYRNRTDYRKLQERRQKMRKEHELNNVINNLNKPLF